MKAREYCLEAKYLPDILKDFHDQKDLFKTFWDWWGREIENELGITWSDAHIFTIDKFLWFMGLHGYKLQKDRSKGVDFYDINDSIKAMDNKQVEMLKKLMNQGESSERKTN